MMIMIMKKTMMLVRRMVRMASRKSMVVMMNRLSENDDKGRNSARLLAGDSLT